MWRTARTMRSDDRRPRSTRRRTTKPTRAAWWAVFVFVLLMIVREGMETALPADLAVDAARRSGTCWSAACSGVTRRRAARVGVDALRPARSISPRFFQVTAVFLLIFSVQLVIYTFHELFEAGVVPFVDNEYWHIATEPYGPEGVYGEWLTYLMVLVPAGWLALRLAEGPAVRRRPARALTGACHHVHLPLQRDHRPRRSSRAAEQGARSRRGSRAASCGVGTGCGRCTVVRQGAARRDWWARIDGRGPTRSSRCTPSRENRA